MGNSAYFGPVSLFPGAFIHATPAGEISQKYFEGENGLTTPSAVDFGF